MVSIQTAIGLWILGAVLAAFFVARYISRLRDQVERERRISDSLQRLIVQHAKAREAVEI